MAERGDDLFDNRVAKAERLRQRGIDPYPARVTRSHSAAEAAAVFTQAEGGGASEGPVVAIAGRTSVPRRMGKLTFLHLTDGSGRIQAQLTRDRLGDDAYDVLKEIEAGDFLGVRGPLMRTRTGEITVLADQVTVLAKALRAPPEKWHGLTDVETRYRRRYLDLLANEEVRALFRARSRAVSTIRRFMDERGFIEVETPVLQPTAGGAAARPFVTHHNALDEDRFLRIATELHLKRLIVGGLDKVYEIGRIFRNEGISTKHNPEFTMLESYEAYADYHDVARMVESLVATVAQEVLGGLRLPYREGVIDVTPPWLRRTMRDLLIEHAGLDFTEFRDADRLREELRRRRIDTPAGASWGKLLDELWSSAVEPKLIQPVFVLDYPVDISPLAKRKTDDPTLVERFEAFAGGFEIANAYSELNDPIDQRQRFETQLRQRAAGDDEAELLDEDFLLALEHGMPPTGGLGIGIDRLLMVLLNQASIREVILFPQLRTLDQPASEEPA